jgi:TIR domain
MASSVRDKVFISYSREDKKWLDLLLQTLAPLIRAKPNTIWWDGLIRAGQEWEKEIESNLASAKVAVLLVSPGFLASEFILKKELKALLGAAQTRGVTVLWSLVRNCWWENTPLRNYQAVPYQQTHTMKAWNVLGEAELEDLLVVVAKEIDDRLRSDLAPPAAPEEADTVQTVAEPAAKADTTRAESGHRNAERMLKGVEELAIVAEIGDLFVLRRRWPDAKFTYDRMIELAAPYKELWMAWGYEKLGLVHRQEEAWKAASECWRLAQLLYRRIGRADKAAEVERLLQAIPPE